LIRIAGSDAINLFTHRVFSDQQIYKAITQHLSKFAISKLILTFKPASPYEYTADLSESMVYILTSTKKYLLSLFKSRHTTNY